jgi:hypothetical protein
MSNPTSNFGWQMPTATDLVTDLPADFEVFGQAVDTALMDLKGGTTGQVLKKNTNADMDFVWAADSAGMTNPMTTTGDTIYSSSGSTPARLGIGTAGQILQVNSGATAPEWASPAGGGANWSILNSGGTVLTGAGTITVSGISGKDKILILVSGASAVGGSTYIDIRLNTDSASNYYYFGIELVGDTNYSAGNMSELNINGTSRIALGNTPNVASGTLSGYVLLSGCNASGVKAFNAAGAGSFSGSNGQSGMVAGGYYNSSSTISSISVISRSGNLDAGTVYVYTSA